MEIKMLESMAGVGFSLSAGDITDRFSDKECGRFIRLGIAEKAPPKMVKKPETKKEWDEEREKLLVELSDLRTEVETLKAREADLLQQADAFRALKATLALSIGVSLSDQETAVKSAAPETR